MHVFVDLQYLEYSSYACLRIRIYCHYIMFLLSVAHLPITRNISAITILSGIEDFCFK